MFGIKAIDKFVRTRGVMTSLRALSPDQLTVTSLIGGECRATAMHEIGYSTVLGSCVSLCLFDPETRAGGLNHFLLPASPEAAPAGDRAWSFRYGVQAMEELFNALFRLTGRPRNGFRAKLVGGARLSGALADVGERNVQFAESFLAQERVPIVSRETGGNHGRRLLFHPASGRAFIKIIERDVGADLRSAEERLLRAPKPAPPAEVELF